MDQKPRYIPEELMTTKGMSKVARYIIYPPGNPRPASPIVKELTAVACHMFNGLIRWFGFQHAHINSELRLVVRGFPEGFEEVSKWEECREL